MYNYHLSYVINSVNINKAKKSFYLNIKYSSKIFKILKFLKFYNFIHDFKINKKKIKPTCRVYLYSYKTKNTLFLFKLLSKPSKKVFVSYKSLRLLNKKSGSSVFLISTSKGIISITTALKNKISGFLVGFISM